MKMGDFESWLKRLEQEQTEGWAEKNREIPFIPMKSGWEIKPIAPFGGLFARFQIRTDAGYKSVYLDWFDRAGCVGQPYWEVYPVRGDTARCLLDEVDELVRLLEEPGEADEKKDEDKE